MFFKIFLFMISISVILFSILHFIDKFILKDYFFDFNCINDLFILEYHRFYFDYFCLRNMNFIWKIGAKETLKTV